MRFEIGQASFPSTGFGGLEVPHECRAFQVDGVVGAAGELALPVEYEVFGGWPDNIFG